MPDCVFCKIVKGDIPCAKILETEELIAFLDINPVRPGHTLIVPKIHAETLFDLPPDSAEKVVRAMQHVGRALMKATNAAGMNVIQNNYPASGQEVPHIHWHLIPRHDGDGLKFWPQGSYTSMEDMSAMAKSVRDALD